MHLGDQYRKSMMALVGLVLAAALAPVAASAAPAADPPAVTAARDLELDPGTGRVFVSVADRVDVYGPTGSHLATVSNVPGAWGMDAAQGSIWVNASTTDQIVRIDPVTMAVTKRYAVNQPLGDDLTIIGGSAWFGLAGDWSGEYVDWGRFDLATSTYERRGSTWGPATGRLGTSTSHLLVWNRGVTRGDVLKVATSGSADAVAVGQLRNFGDLVVSDPSGSKVWVNGGASIEEHDGGTLASAGVKYTSEAGYPGRFAHVAANGGMLVGTAGTSFTAFTVGSTAPVMEVPFSDVTGVAAVRVSPDGSTGYYLLTEPAGSTRLQLVDLRPAATAATSSGPVVAGAPTRVTVTGRSLGGTTTVKVGGLTVAPTSIAPDRVTFTTPTSLTAGTKDVVLTGRTGTASTSLVVAPSTGANLTGTVRVGTALGAGVNLILSGGPLGSPRTATAAADGTYAFPGVPAGSGYLLTALDPAASAPDQLIRNLTVAPNATTTIDVDLSRPRPDGADLASTDLGSAAVRDLLVDPATGRVVVATGDEVDVLDADGRLITRIRGMDGVESLTPQGGSVYAGLGNSGRVTRIDLATTAITGSWALGRPTTGQIAASGGKIWFVDGDDQWTKLRSLDPATGAFSDAGASSSDLFYVPDLDAVAGAPDRFLASSSNETSLLDGTAPVGLELVTSPLGSSTTPQAPLVADAATSKVYDSQGRRYSLHDLRPDGAEFAGTGQPSLAAGHGGLVAVGGTVSRRSSPTPTHAFTGAWTASGLDAGGSRLYTTLGDQLLVHDLAPHIDATSPEPHYEGRTASIEGSGLGAASSVTIDGTSVPFEAVGASRIDIELDGLAPGRHRVQVTTPWGSSGAAPFTVLAPRAPGAPTGVSAAADYTGIEVTWEALLDDGGRTITGYTATASPGGATCSTTGATLCRFTTLTPGTNYTFVVRATNAIGPGPASAATSPVRMPTVPTVPQDVSATPGLRSIEVTWSAPADPGGIPLNSYRVCWSTDPTVPTASSSCRDVPFSATSTRITGLSARVAYAATVTAVNDVGAGPRSAPTSPTETFDQPDAPTSLVATPDRYSAHVSWTAGADDGGSPVVGYVVCAEQVRPEGGGWSGGCQTFDGAATSATVTELQGGVTYRFHAYTRTAAGWSEESEDFATAAIPQNTPPPPRAVLVEAASRGLAVAWIRNDIEGGTPTTGHVVCTSTSPTMAGASCTSTGVTPRLDVTGLEPHVPHYVTVAGVNALGTGPASPVSAATSPYDVPGAPTAVTATAGDRTADVTWLAPSDDGGNPVVAYDVTPYIGAAPQATQTLATNGSTQQITGLTNGVTYTFVVRARNGGGAGAASARSAPVTPTGAMVPAPFATWDAFVARQLTDFTGSAGTPSGRAATVAKLTSGTTTPAAFVEGLIDHPWYGPAVAPTTRLYWAYFGRIPDHSGLEYWAGKRRKGTTLVRISASFAGSPEFRRTYGSLSNAAFVDLVYRNVLGRSGDAGGRSYWTGKLNKGISRGQVMVNFSESGEYVRKTAGRVGVVEVYAAMLDRSPTVEELTRWETHPVRSLIDVIRLGDGYDDRVS